MRFDHLFADQKTKSRTAFFGRLKRREQFRKVFRCNSSAAVDQIQADKRAADTSVEPDGSGSVHCFVRIFDQIKKRAFKTVRVDVQLRKRRL